MNNKCIHRPTTGWIFQKKQLAHIFGISPYLYRTLLRTDTPRMLSNRKRSIVPALLNRLSQAVLNLNNLPILLQRHLPVLLYLIIGKGIACSPS